MEKTRTSAQQSLKYRQLPVFLRELREKAGLSQRAMAKLVSRSPSYIYNCETGNRRVDIAEFIQWCKCCGVSPLLFPLNYAAGA